MNRINYCASKNECEKFLNNFGFIYHIPNLKADNERYYIELTSNLEEVYFCSIERISNNSSKITEIFFDKDIEFYFKDGVMQRRYWTKEQAKSFYDEMEDLEFQINGDVMTFSEASEKWDLKDSTLRKARESNRFLDGEVRQSGKVWLVTKKAMERIYGEQKY